MTRNLVLSPSNGTFDTRKVKAFLEAQPDVFADPHGTEAFIISGLPESVWSKQRERREDSASFPYAALVFVAPDRILVNQEMADAEELRSSLAFVKWMWENFDLTIRDDYGPDLTERSLKEGVESLYPEKVRSMPVPWAGRFIKLGFFRELDHGDSDGPSLEESRGEAAGPDDERIARYLESGHRYIAASGVVTDMLSDDPAVEIGPPHLLTDGTYAWPADLPYYVRKYHVRLPKPFLVHVAGNNFQIPADLDLARVKLE
jgi:hypothetical protein